MLNLKEEAMSIHNCIAPKYPYIDLLGKIYPVDDICGFIEFESSAFLVFYATQVVYNENNTQVKSKKEIVPGNFVTFSATHHYFNMRETRCKAVASIVWFKNKPKQQVKSSEELLSMYARLILKHNPLYTPLLSTISVDNQQNKFIRFNGRNGRMFPMNNHFSIIECRIGGVVKHVICSRYVLIFNSYCAPHFNAVAWNSKISLNCLETKTNDRAEVIYLASLAWNKHKNFTDVEDSDILELYKSYLNRTQHSHALIADFKKKRRTMSLSSYANESTSSIESVAVSSRPSSISGETVSVSSKTNSYQASNSSMCYKNSDYLNNSPATGVNACKRNLNDSESFNVNIGTIFPLSSDGGLIRFTCGKETREIEFIKEVVFIDGKPIKDAWNDIKVSIVNFEHTTISTSSSSKYVATLVWNGVRPKALKNKEEIITIYGKNLTKLICNGIDKIQNVTINDCGSNVAELPDNCVATSSDVKSSSFTLTPFKSKPSQCINGNMCVAKQLEISPKSPDIQFEDGWKENCLKSERKDSYTFAAEPNVDSDSDLSLTTIKISEILIQTKLKKKCFTVKVMIDSDESDNSSAS